MNAISGMAHKNFRDGLRDGQRVKPRNEGMAETVNDFGGICKAKLNGQVAPKPRF
jgi:hypothetical protein